MERNIEIDGKHLTMRATAKTPIIYRTLLGRDMIHDMKILEKQLKLVKEEKEIEFSAEALMIFANVSWIFLAQGGKKNENNQYENNGILIADTPMEWLDTIDEVFSIYKTLPDVMSLWSNLQIQTSKPAKK